MLTRLLIAAMFLAGVSCAPPAVADPTETATLEHGTTICAMLNLNPTVTELENTVYYLMGLGYELQEAAGISVLSIHGMCPYHLPLVEELVFVPVLV